MTYFITAHTNDLAQLIVSETRTTDGDLADLIVASLHARGLLVTFRTES